MQRVACQVVTANFRASLCGLGPNSDIPGDDDKSLVYEPRASAVMRVKRSSAAIEIVTWSGRPSTAFTWRPQNKGHLHQRLIGTGKWVNPSPKGTGGKAPSLSTA